MFFTGSFKSSSKKFFFHVFVFPIHAITFGEYIDFHTLTWFLYTLNYTIVGVDGYIDAKIGCIE